MNQEQRQEQGQGQGAVNKKASPFLAIAIIAVLTMAVAGAILAYQYYYFPKEEVVISIIDEAVDESIVDEPIVDGETADWKIYRNEEFGFEMKYPEEGINQAKEPFITAKTCDFTGFSVKCPAYQDILPQLNITITGPDIRLNRLILDDAIVCNYIVSEGIAGGSYSNYYYISSKNEKCLVVSLESIRITNCNVYGGPEDPEFQKCEYYNTVELPNLLNQILSTFKFTK